MCQSRHCRQPLKRVTSATCADGCATVRSGANNRPKNRGRSNRHPCNPDFLNQFPTISATVLKSPNTRLPRPPRLSQKSRNVSPQPKPGAGKSLHRALAAIATATVAADAEAGEADLSRRLRRQSCRLLADRPAKLPRPIQLPKWLSRWPLPAVLLLPMKRRSRRAQSCFQ